MQTTSARLLQLAWRHIDDKMRVDPDQWAARRKQPSYRKVDIFNPVTYDADPHTVIKCTDNASVFDDRIVHINESRRKTTAMNFGAFITYCMLALKSGKYVVSRVHHTSRVVMPRMPNEVNLYYGCEWSIRIKLDVSDGPELQHMHRDMDVDILKVLIRVGHRSGKNHVLAINMVPALMLWAERAVLLFRGGMAGCLNAQCPRVLPIDAAGRSVCIECKTEQCVPCKTAWLAHAGLTCKQFQFKNSGSGIRDPFIAAALLKGSMQPCMNCSAILERIEGCNRVMCAGCKTHMCWACGTCGFRSMDAVYDHLSGRQCADASGITDASPSDTRVRDAIAARNVRIYGDVLQRTIDEAEIEAKKALVPDPKRDAELIKNARAAAIASASKRNGSVAMATDNINSAAIVAATDNNLDDAGDIAHVADAEHVALIAVLRADHAVITAYRNVVAGILPRENSTAQDRNIMDVAAEIALDRNVMVEASTAKNDAALSMQAGSRGDIVDRLTRISNARTQCYQNAHLAAAAYFQAVDKIADRILASYEKKAIDLSPAARAAAANLMAAANNADNENKTRYLMPSALEKGNLYRDIPNMSIPRVIALIEEQMVILNLQADDFKGAVANAVNAHVVLRKYALEIHEADLRRGIAADDRNKNVIVSARDIRMIALHFAEILNRILQRGDAQLTEYIGRAALVADRQTIDTTGNTFDHRRLDIDFHIASNAMANITRVYMGANMIDQMLVAMKTRTDAYQKTSEAMTNYVRAIMKMSRIIYTAMSNVKIDEVDEVNKIVEIDAEYITPEAKRQNLREYITKLEQKLDNAVTAREAEDIRVRIADADKRLQALKQKVITGDIADMQMTIAKLERQRDHIVNAQYARELLTRIEKTQQRLQEIKWDMVLVQPLQMEFETAPLTYAGYAGYNTTYTHTYYYPSLTGLMDAGPMFGRTYYVKFQKIFMPSQLLLEGVEEKKEREKKEQKEMEEKERQNAVRLLQWHGQQRALHPAVLLPPVAHIRQTYKDTCIAYRMAVKRQIIMPRRYAGAMRMQRANNMRRNAR